MNKTFLILLLANEPRFILRFQAEVSKMFYVYAGGTPLHFKEFL
jgi:hypothetical protein